MRARRAGEAAPHATAGTRGSPPAFGSRGFGHRTASGFLALAQGLPFEGRTTAGEMDSPPVLLSTAGDLGRAYVSAMELAGAYAYAGRDVVVDRVLEILGARATYDVHDHHNYAWREEHEPPHQALGPRPPRRRRLARGDQAPCRVRHRPPRRRSGRGPRGPQPPAPHRRRDGGHGTHDPYKD